ncbi:MAG: YfhO family protein [Bacteroidota bacterium]
MKKKPQISSNKKVLDSKTKPKLIIHTPVQIPIWFASIIFFTSTLLFFWDQIFSQAFFWEDITELWYPFQTFAAKTFAKGLLPFWNPYIFSGMPFLADIEVGFFYPLNRILSLFVDSNGHLTIWAVQFAIIVHFFIAQIGTFKLAQYWKISSVGALISSVSFAFSLMFVCHVIHPMMLFHFSWFPLVLLFFMRGLEENKIKYSILSAWVLAISMLAGHPQSTLYEVMFLCVFLVWYLIFKIKNKNLSKNTIAKFIACSTLPFIIAVGIFSIQLFPSRELASMAHRQEITYDKATEGSLQFKQIYTSVIPKIFGSVDGETFKEKNFNFHLEDAKYYEYWETAFYFGIVALILGLFGMTQKFRTKEGIILLSIIGFSFLYSLGKNFFVFEIFFNLPLFEYFRMPARMMYYFVLAFSLFAGFGFDALWNKGFSIAQMKKLIYVTAVPLIIALLASFGALQSILSTPLQYQPAIKGFGALALFFIIIVFGLSFFINRQKLHPSIGGGIFVVIVLVDLLLAGASFNKNSDNPEKVYEINQETKAVFSAKPPKELFRVSIRLYQEGVIAMTRNQGMMDNIMTTDGYNPLVLKRGGAPTPLLKNVHDLNNVKYAILKDTVAGGFRFFEYQPYTSRAWVVHKAIILHPDSVFNAMRTKVFNFKNEIILEEPITRKLSGNPPDSVSDKTECLDFDINHFKYKISSKEAGVVFFSEIWYPAWQAYLDGKPVKILRSNYCFRGVEVPGGTHTIEMKYESNSFSKGLYLSLATIILSILGFVFAVYKERN